LRGQYGENDEEGFGQEGDANKGHEIVPYRRRGSRANADPNLKHVGLTTYDAKDPNTKYPPITTLRPPMSAPNVMIVLIDDVGFGASSAFGGP
jgi:arylsulfatase